MENQYISGWTPVKSTASPRCFLAWRVVTVPQLGRRNRYVAGCPGTAWVYVWRLGRSGPCDREHYDWSHSSMDFGTPKFQTLVSSPYHLRTWDSCFFFSNGFWMISIFWGQCGKTMQNPKGAPSEGPRFNQRHPAGSKTVLMRKEFYKKMRVLRKPFVSLEKCYNKNDSVASRACCKL